MSQVVLSCEEMLAAQSQVHRDSMAYVGSMCLRFAVELGIPEIISAYGRPMSKAELISKLGSIPPRRAEFLFRILRLLAQMGYFKIQKQCNNNNNGGSDGEEETILYSLTPLSMMLLQENLSAAVPYASNPKMVNMFQCLTRWFRSRRPECVHDFVVGKSLWVLANGSPEDCSAFNESMASWTRVIMKGVVERCKDAFKGLHSIVDVGGGTGTASRVIAQAFPGVKCIVYDLPHVISSSVPNGSHIEAIGGDMFEHVPRADAIFLKHILHDWDDESCVKILKKCKEAIPTRGGKVIIVDMVINDAETSAELMSKLISDITMMTMVDGKERDENEWKKIFSEAGFTRYKISPVGWHSLIQLFP